MPFLAAPQPDSYASSGHAWRLWAARHSQEEAGPLGAQPLPRLLELAASKPADFTGFDLVGMGGLGAEPHLNTCFKHYMYFVNEFDLIPRKEELQPLQELIDRLEP